MKHLFLLILFFIGFDTAAQQPEPLSIFDGRAWGTVLEHPDMKNVMMKHDVTYLSDEKGTLKMDVYLPPGIQSNEKRPAVVFLNAIGDNADQMKVKSWGIYTSWPKLMAAHGYIGISMECDRLRVQESLSGIFSFIGKQGANYNIDVNKLGVYAASANVSQSLVYLMKPDAHPGIKAAVLYYGGYSTGPYRKDLPVFFVVAEGDLNRTGYTTLWAEVLKNSAPWTIAMGSGLIHAFDAFSDDDDSRKMIKETISFWKNHLDPIPAHSWPNSMGREVLAAQYGGNNNKAATILKSWVEVHPDDSRTLFQYGNILQNLNRHSEAEAVFRKVIVLDPQNTAAEADLIVSLYALNRNDEAEKLFASVEKTGRLTRIEYSSIGIALYIMARHREGLKYFEKIMDIGPVSVDVYNLACGYARLNEKDKAFSALDRAATMGYNSKQHYEQDGDLDLLRSDKRYQDLLTRLK